MYWITVYTLVNRINYPVFSFYMGRRDVCNTSYMEGMPSCGLFFSFLKEWLKIISNCEETSSRLELTVTTWCLLIAPGGWATHGTWPLSLFSLVVTPNIWPPFVASLRACFLILLFPDQTDLSKLRLVLTPLKLLVWTSQKLCCLMLANLLSLLPSPLLLSLSILLDATNHFIRPFSVSLKHPQEQSLLKSFSMPSEFGQMRLYVKLTLKSVTA